MKRPNLRQIYLQDKLLSLSGRHPEGLKIRLEKLINMILLIKKRQAAEDSPAVASPLKQALRWPEVLSSLMLNYFQIPELYKTNPDQSRIVALISKMNGRAERIDRAQSHEYRNWRTAITMPGMTASKCAYLTRPVSAGRENGQNPHVLKIKPSPTFSGRMLLRTVARPEFSAVIQNAQSEF